MTPHYEDGSIRIYSGEALEVLSAMPDESVDCCVTSPPYWGLRDYKTGRWEGGDQQCDHVRNHGVQGRGQREGRTFTAQAVYAESCGKCGAIRVDKQLGLEKTPEEYIAKLVAIFREVRRILRDDGTLWLNLGDSYSSHPGQRAVGDKVGGKQSTNEGSGQVGSRSVENLKPKDLIGIPWMAAFALRADGWYLRSDIVWAKPNPMPESVDDRPTRSHEYLFLMTKSQRYYYDADAIAEPSVAGHSSGNGFKRESRLTYSDKNGARGADEEWVPGGKHSKTEAQASGRRINESVARARASGADHDNPFGPTRNKRSVWTVNTEPFPDAHFAVFPEALIEPCIKAGCPVGGTVLDPFSGSGTTGVVARRFGCNYIGVELNPDYIEMSKRRLAQQHLSLNLDEALLL